MDTIKITNAIAVHTPRKSVSDFDDTVAPSIPTPMPLISIAKTITVTPNTAITTFLVHAELLLVFISQVMIALGAALDINHNAHLQDEFSQSISQEVYWCSKCAQPTER